ncbi:beta-galactosidase [Daphnia magna]|uniref:beta-galactosidase n=1 Tax=Daphnia magna TaxID=35525 RepID=UPI001E1BDE36|nr:beta-galactosidase [Daphnia magna]
MIVNIVFLCIVCCLTQSSNGDSLKESHNFSIDYANNQFIKDGKPFRYVSGAMHYFRVPFQYWPDRMRKMRASGLNALETYVEWVSHEPQPGSYVFEGNLDIESYLQLAQNFNLSVILRPGPFIDAERDMGGLPFWLMAVDPSIKLRTMDKSYVASVEKWFSVLLPKIKPYLYNNGGPIITVQVENEYGSYSACDRDYTSWLRDLIRKHLGNDVVLFSTDGDGDGYLQCGKIPGVYATVDFGAGANALEAFKPQRHFELAGPRVNSEFYPGWLDLWGEPHSKVDKRDVAKTLDDMLALNASVSMYMFHGGTSFGFTSGALPSNTYTPCITSYDYDAPLNEAGDPTEKYFSIRDVISKYLPLPDFPAPGPNPKAAYGFVHLHYVAHLWDILSTPIAGPLVHSISPLTFEALGQANGYVLYCTKLHGHFPDPALLEIKGLADRAYIYIDMEFVGVLSRSGSLFSIPVQAADNQKLCILVENQGRIAYGSGIKDFKGLTSQVTINGRILVDWTHRPLPFNDTVKLDWLNKLEKKQGFPIKGTLSLFSGSFAIRRNESKMADTFLSLSGWHKGVVFLNGINLGRYWPVQGPQVTLYVPKYFLRAWPSKNRLIILEQDRSPCNENVLDCVVEFVAKPVLDGDTPAKKSSIKLFKKRV